MGQGQGGTNGAQLEERYFLQKVKLGQGSFGTVWRAVDRQGGNTVAIKQLDKASLPRRGVTRQDIEREISMMKAVSHENITQLFDTFEDATNIYLALEYCEGGDFGDKVKERGMGVAESEVADWCRQMCAAIAALHSKGVCHRDIKPDNFMVSGTTTLKLSDFGLAVYLPKGKLLQEKCGTPAFMAPEQHHLPKRSPGYSFPADIWAAGVSMYMMFFAGKHPFLNDRGHLDDNLLLTGELDFKDKTSGGGFFGFGSSSLRFSEEARRLCKCMVEPDPQRRISAQSALTHHWLHTENEKGQGRPSGSPSGTPPPPLQQGAEAEGVNRQRSTTPRARTPTGAGERDKSAEHGQARGSRDAPDVFPRGRGGGSGHRTPPPGGDAGPKALQEAAKLKEHNEALLSELEERKKREEHLVQQQKRLQHQQQLLQHQRTKELQLQNEKLIEQEKQLQRVEQEKKELERQKDAGERGAKSTPVGRKESSSRSGYFRRGLKCRYESGTYGWMSAVVQGYNESDGTYNLDVRQHAALDKIAPSPDVNASEAWPPGTLAAYHSASVNQWLPALVTSFNETDSTYNLDVRDHADVDRIRARVTDLPEGQGSGHSDQVRKATSSNSGLRTEVAEASASRGYRPGPTKDFGDRDGTTKAPLRVSDLEATGLGSVAPGNSPTASAVVRKVGVGDRCTIPDDGLVVIESVSVGTYTVKTMERRKLQVQADVMRAPGDAKFAWPAGTKVSYQSASLSGKWIDANVVSFNPSNGTYNLDVRIEAAPDKVRPR